MTIRRGAWFDDDAGPLARPYSMTGGRTDGDRRDLDMITLVVAVKPEDRDDHRHRSGGRAAPHRSRLGAARPEPEYADILRLCELPLSVAEVAANLNLPMLVTKVLVGDLIDDGHLDYRAPSKESGLVDINVMRAVLDGIRKI